MYIKKEYMEVITEVAKYLEQGELPDTDTISQFLEVEDELSAENARHIRLTTERMNENRKINPRYGRPKETKYVKPRCPFCGRALRKSQVDGYAWECKVCDEDFYTFEVKYI